MPTHGNKYDNGPPPKFYHKSKGGVGWKSKKVNHDCRTEAEKKKQHEDAVAWRERGKDESL